MKALHSLMNVALLLAGTATVLCGQSVGSISGFVTDKDFEAPLAGVTVRLSEVKLEAKTGRQGGYSLTGVPPGTYTVVYSKDGYVRQVRAKTLVREGVVTALDVAMPGEFTEMEEFVVQDALKLNSGSEAALLDLRFESAALMDSVGGELISRAGASDAAAALKLVSGATVKDGKTAVIRGLPDRYVSSKMNGIRLPSADEDKRAVELDQFPSAVIESIQVSKSFTPDQRTHRVDPVDSQRHHASCGHRHLMVFRRSEGWQ